jgi:hypothetical protein
VRLQAAPWEFAIFPPEMPVGKRPLGNARSETEKAEHPLNREIEQRSAHAVICGLPDDRRPGGTGRGPHRPFAPHSDRSRRLDLGDWRYLAAVLLAARARLAGAFLAGDFFAAAGLALADRLAFTAGALAFVAFLAPLAAGLALSDRVDLAAVGFADFLAGFALALGDRLVVALAAPFAPLTLRLLAFFAAAFLVAAILWLLML